MVALRLASSLSRTFIATFAVAVLVVSVLPVASAAITTYGGGAAGGAAAIVQAMTRGEAAVPNSFVTGASWVHYTNSAPAAVGTSNAQITGVFGIPDGAKFAILTTGDASKAQGAQGNFASGARADALYKGAHDVVVLEVDIDVPSTHDCVALSIQYMSEEYPEYVQPQWSNTEYSDAFLAELDQNSWTISGSTTNPTINAPDNFAFTPANQVITANTVPMSAGNAAGSIYDGGSVTYTGQSQITPGPHKLFFSIFDMGDDAYDSAVFIDDLHTLQTGGPNCKPGITYPNPQADFTWVNSPSCGPPNTPFLVNFDGSLTQPGSPGGGAISTYAWSFGDAATFGPVASPLASHTYATFGTYPVTLTVTDANAKTNSITQQVNVPSPCPLPPPNYPPTATINVDNSLTSCQDTTIFFSATASDPERDALTYLWTFPDGYSTTQQAFNRIIVPEGPYTVTLKVSDGKNPPVFVAKNFQSFGDPNCCPVLTHISDLFVIVGAFTDFEAATTDFEGDAVTVTATGLPPTAKFSADGVFTWQTKMGDAGDYTVLVSASDAGCTADAAVVIHVIKPPAPPQLDDSDEDGILDASDNCPSVPNHDQADADRDHIGDACDVNPDTPDASHVASVSTLPPGTPDADHDGIPDASDNCPTVPNQEQADLDGDHVGDACDADLDGDSVPQIGEVGAFLDNCPVTPNMDQTDTDHDGIGDECQYRLASASTGGQGPVATPVASAPASTPILTKLMMVAAPTGVVALLGALVILVRRGSRPR